MADIHIINITGTSTTAEIDVHSLDNDGVTERDTGPASTALDGANDAFDKWYYVFNIN